MIYCRKCGELIRDDSQFCFKCGAHVIPATPVSSSVPRENPAVKSSIPKDATTSGVIYSDPRERSVPEPEVVEQPKKKKYALEKNKC